MVSWLTDLVKTYLEKLIDGAIAETRYVCCFTSIAEEFKEEQARLEAERRTVEQRVNVATGRGNDILFKVGEWQKKADQLLQEDTKTKKKCFFGFCPDCIWRYKRGKELADKIVTMKQLVDKGEKFENIEIPRRLPDVEFHSSQSYIHFKGRESEYKELLEALKDENNFTIGLHGMGGSGKTTLAIKVGKKLKQSENFAHVIDVTVSYTPNIKKIQDDIAGPLGLEWKDCDESDRPKKLWSRLTNGEKILLILDDVWDQKQPLDFDAIGIPKQDNHKGCRVLVTTRNKRLLNKMGCHKIIKLEDLSEEDSRIMFESYAGITNNSPKSLIDKGREIVDKCKRLPIAIAVVASSLKGQESIEEWDLALKSLRNLLSFKQSDDESLDETLVEIYNCLKFSYDYLKDEKVKRLFLLCSVFPEDKEIDVEILTRLGIGTGLFGEDYGSYNDGRNQVVVAKNKLLDSCLLLEAGKGCVKMHDLIREVAQWIANKEIRTVNMSHRDPKSLIDRDNNTKYLFWEGNIREMFSSGFGGSNLEILIAAFEDYGYCGEVPNSFFENMAGLRVLKLEQKNIYYHTQLAFTSQPSIQSWMNIRSLLFSNFDLGDISVLVNLQSLETLDLNSCEITELPHEITKLEKLKLLKLRRCEIRRNNPFKVIEKCSFLDELYFHSSFNKFCKRIDFSLKLQRYVIDTRWKDVESDVSVSKAVELPRDEDLYIFSEATLKYFIQTTEYLVLGSIKWRWRNLIPEIVPVDQGMNDVVHLELRNSSELQYLIKVIGSQVPNVFSKLVVLKLHGMEKLEELCNAPLDLCNLKRISLLECPLLVSVFQLSTAKSLIMLEELEIDDCEQLESLIADEKSGEESKDEILVDDGDNEDKKNNSSMFSKLKVLDIRNCPRLEVVLPFLYGDLPVQLETISIERCDKLKYIFHQFIELDSLKELRLDGLLGIFPESMALFAKGSSSTLREDFKEPTQLDPIKCNVFSWTQKCCYGLKNKHKLRSSTSTKIPLVSKGFSGQPQILYNIITINLRNVSKIKSLFILSTARRMLQLETLTIWDCEELKHIIVDIGDDNGENNSSNVFPRLKHLEVYNCEQLEYIFGHYVDDHESHNEIHLHLPELKSLELQYVPSLVAMCPKQYHITFSPLVTLRLKGCSQVAGKSIGDFMSHASSSTIKELSGNVEHFLALETLVVTKSIKQKSKIENVFILNETNGQQLNLMLNHIFLEGLHVMTYIFVGPKSSVTLHNLTFIKIEGCEKLETLFSTCVVRCFPQLHYLCIEGCNDLKYIIEEDAEDEMISNSLPTATGTCFPKLETLQVEYCNKLEFVFPVSICKELHKLKVLMIREANALQEVFRSKDAQKVEIPNLRVIVFVNLPSLSQTQAIQFQNVEHRLVENCQKLSLTSVSTLSDDEIEHLDFGAYVYIKGRREETTKDFATGIEVQATWGHELSSSQEFLNEPPTSQQHPVGEADTTAKPSRGNICLEETKDESIQEILISEKGSTTVMGSFKKSDEQETTLDNVVTVNTSTPVESVSSSSTPLVNFEHKTSLHVKDDEIRVSEPKPSPTTNSSLASQSISTLYEGNPPQTVENPSSSSLITRELQQLVSKNHLASENLSDYHQLTDLPTGIEVQLSCIISEHELSSLQCLEEIQATSASEKDITTIMSTNSETRSKPPTQSLSPKSKQESFKTSVEEGTMLVNTKTITSSTHSESGSLVTSELKTSSNEAGYGKISITSQTNDQRVKDRNLTAETSKDFSVGVKVQAASGHKLTSSQEFLNEPSTSQQHPVGEADTTAKPSRGNNCLEETKDESIQEVLISEKATTTVMESFKRIDQQGTTLDNVNTVATSTPIESVSSEHKTSLHVKDDEISVSEPKPSPTTSFVASQSISTPYEGNPPQTVENPSTSSLIIRELQQLVSKNHLASENLSLLTDFLVKHPSVHLKDAYKVGNKYKGYAYNCLAELLIFLQTRSILDVVGSSRSKFVELLQEARSFDFDKDWLDGVEKRVLFPDLHLSQDALEKLFHSKQQVTKEIEMLRLKIGIFTQHVEELKHQLASSEAVLENISQQEAQVLESRAALSAPLGY